MNRLIYVFTFIVVVLLAGSSLADIPKLINYQGMLTDDAGNPLTDTVNITFKIYNDSLSVSPGDKKWEETHSDVPVIHGLFNVMLGGMSSLDLDFSEDYWLDITVGGEHQPERLRFVSVGYAYRARWAQRSDTADYALSSPSVPGGYTWIFRITDGGDTTITTGGCWGIARFGNTLYGNADSTHVNLGVVCTTGTSGQDYKYCTVGGGRENAASGSFATVGGGIENTADTSYATVGGGRRNIASGYHGTVGGGSYNTASGHHATVGGGSGNRADTNYATVGGGYCNTASGFHATVGGGSTNSVDTNYATVGGGYYNTASGCDATVGGGYNNTASGCGAIVGGGYSNEADGDYATVAGGCLNTASGNFSFAAGHRAKANHTGAFVWADETYADFASTGENQFLIRAAGGVGIGVTNPEEMMEIESAAADQRAFLKIQASHPTHFDEVGIRLETPQNRWHLRMDDYENDNLPDTGSLALRSQNSGIEVMTWTNDGDVGIGTTGPTEKLDVNGTARLRGISAGSATPVHVDGSGKLWKQSSSRRYKQSITKLEVDSEKVLELSPVSFKWKTTQGEDVGLIAEEVEQVLPELVVHDEEGRPDAVKYDKVALYLLELVKSQHERISALEQKIAELEK